MRDIVTARVLALPTGAWARVSRDAGTTRNVAARAFGALRPYAAIADSVAAVASHRRVDEGQNMSHSYRAVVAFL